MKSLPIVEVLNEETLTWREVTIAEATLALIQEYGEDHHRAIAELKDNTALPSAIGFLRIAPEWFLKEGGV